jgi:four helix bundle protein
MASYQSFKELDCWQKAQLAKIWVYDFLKSVPKDEYDIHQNMKRAARSGTRNIAEGFGRHHHKENIQFCRISRGSLFEILDDIDDCLLQNYLNEIDAEKGEQIIKAAIKSINGYIKYLTRLI